MRKLLVLFIAMLSVFVLAGCGGESGTQTQDEEPAAETGKVYNLRIAAQESYEHNDVQSLVRAAEAIKEKRMAMSISIFRPTNWAITPKYMMK